MTIPYNSHIDTLIQMAIAEDVGKNDITSHATIPDQSVATAYLRCKSNCIIVGLLYAKSVFEKISPDIHWHASVNDGYQLQPGDLIATIHGPTHALLKAERTALNFLQRLSGIAQMTHLFVDKIRDYPTQILDTRKTIPGFRELDKYAAHVGGAKNHRMGLFDHFLIKENHIIAAGSIANALKKAHAYRTSNQKIEIEVRDHNELQQALNGHPDIIMLDNMSIADVKKSVHIVNNAAKIEASGNMTLHTISDYAATGIDYISVGALTHSVIAADIHMLITIDAS